MGYMIYFNWGWLLASSLLGLAMGWIAVVSRVRGVSKRTTFLLSMFAVMLVTFAVTGVIPGRPGYWLDLCLIMFVPYLCGCAIGSLLRDWVNRRGAPVA